MRRDLPVDINGGNTRAPAADPQQLPMLSLSTTNGQYTESQCSSYRNSDDRRSATMTSAVDVISNPARTGGGSPTQTIDSCCWTRDNADSDLSEAVSSADLKHRRRINRPDDGEGPKVPPRHHHHSRHSSDKKMNPSGGKLDARTCRLSASGCVAGESSKDDRVDVQRRVGQLDGERCPSQTHVGATTTSTGGCDDVETTQTGNDVVVIVESPTTVDRSVSVDSGGDFNGDLPVASVKRDVDDGRQCSPGRNSNRTSPVTLQQRCDDVVITNCCCSAADTNNGHSEDVKPSSTSNRIDADGETAPSHRRPRRVVSYDDELLLDVTDNGSPRAAALVPDIRTYKRSDKGPFHERLLTLIGDFLNAF